MSVTETKRAVIAAEDLEDWCGVELGPTGWVTLDQRSINLFAELTGDRQWIHTDPVRAAESPLGTTIAHGYLTLSLVAAMGQQLVEITGVRRRLNYGLNKVRFPASVPVNSRVRGTVKLDKVDRSDTGTLLTFVVSVECEGLDKPACVAQTLTFIPA